MKRFLINLLIFGVLLFVCDRLAGFGMRWMESHARSGQSLKNYEISATAMPDILILGSSRSTHHYVPQLIENVRGEDVYIAGQDGNGVVMMWPVMRYMAERKMPRLVIYDLTSAFDIFEDSPEKYLRYVRPLWGRNQAVDSIISEIDAVEPLKLVSCAYRYNGSLPSLVKGLRGGEVFVDGYSPLEGEFKVGNEANTAISTQEASALKLRFFDEMMDFASVRGIDMLFVISPTYDAKPTSEYKVLKDKIAAHGFEVVDLGTDTAFAGHTELFKDPDHLNSAGAKILTEKILSAIR